MYKNFHAKIWNFSVLLMSLLNLACMKEESPIQRHTSGNVKISSVNLGADYRYQIFYDLGRDTIVSQNLKTDWDLAFESSSDGFHVILNSSKSMYAYERNNIEFSELNDTTGFKDFKNWDMPSGNLDSTAIGNWKTKQSIYVIDRGYGYNGKHLGYFKLQLLSVNDAEYVIKFSDLKEKHAGTNFSVTKDTACNFTYLSFNEGGRIVKIEPPKRSWDICFSQYTHIFYNPTSTYLVTGCLLNRYRTVAAADSIYTFQEIDYLLAKNFDYHSRINIIGYGWKAFANNVYTVRSELNYAIRTNEDFIYKLHFIDFFSSSGQKGAPRWEYQRL